MHMTEGPMQDDSPRVVEQLYDMSLVRGLEDPPASVLGSGDHGIMDALMLSMYEGQGLSPIQPNPALGPPSLDNHPSLSSQLCGLTGDMDPYVLRHYRFDARAEFPFSKLAIRSVQDTEMPVQFLLSNPELSNESKAATSLAAPFAEEALPELSQIVAPEIGERLIQLFLRFINRQFPILSEDSLPAPRAASTHLLAAIYLITQPFTTFDDYLCIEFVYSPPSPQVLFRIAWSELNNALSQPTVQSLQAALILLLHPPLNPLLLDSAAKWTLLGMTVSMAQTLGLHLDPTMWNLPSNEVRTRRRLSWAVFALDKWLAFSFGRPSHISKDNWLITELESSDIEPGDPASGAHPYAIEFSRLTTILDNVLTSLYSLRSLSTLCKDFSLTISSARPLMQDLTTWYTGLPLSLAMEPTPGCKQASDDSASLHIAYQSVKILILRALLRPFHNVDHLSSELERNEEWHAARSQIRQTASAESDAALSLISSLQPAHYQAFWAPCMCDMKYLHKACILTRTGLKTSFACIMNLLFLLAVTAHQLCGSEGTDSGKEYKRQRQTLDRARMVFRLHAKSLDIIRFALLRIDAVHEKSNCETDAHMANLVAVSARNAASLILEFLRRYADISLYQLFYITTARRIHHQHQVVLTGLTIYEIRIQVGGAIGGQTEVNNLLIRDGDLLTGLQVTSEEAGIAVADLIDDVVFPDMDIDLLLSLVIVSRFREELGLDNNPSSSPIAAETSSRSPTLVERVSPFEDKVHVAPVSSQGTDTMEQIQTVRQATSVVLQGSPKTCSRTLFLLPDGSGSATSYASIPRIDKDTCVIALNSPYIKDPSKLSHCSLGDLIKGYLNELRRRRPTGPYHLGGWSAGGILAYRLAQILSDEGEEVRSLILIDSPPPRGLDRLPQHFYEMCDSLNIFGKLGKKTNVEDSKRRAPKKPDWLIPHFNGVIDILHNYWAEPLMDSQCLKVSLIWACGSIMDDANLPPLMPHKDDTEGMKFLTEKRRDFSGNGWEDLFPGSKLVIEKAHGANHFSMMQGPFVIKLAQFIRKAMC
ncbi:hypothetical protein BDV34DRAFT_208264 [Aspergillus parasiticus]|uniref:Xylanolytic transcriptional activator regulatory domain-containing protein n=1 Tax=Aspergillus parasiticus TaxID=5067 RepID=A0A5N6E6R0_ASPPA|nr:hypothetical protein BDV34DRAFT_208264 [Aspergillus parasiticus]